MNNVRRLMIIASVVTTMSACGPRTGEREVVTTAMPDYTPLASGICFQFINYLKDQGNFSDPNLGLKARQNCTERLVKTAEYNGGRLTGKVYDPGSGEDLSRAKIFAISIAGNLPVPADDADADYLAELIERAK